MRSSKVLSDLRRDNSAMERMVDSSGVKDRTVILELLENTKSNEKVIAELQKEALALSFSMSKDLSEIHDYYEQAKNLEDRTLELYNDEKKILKRVSSRYKNSLSLFLAASSSYMLVFNLVAKSPFLIFAIPVIAFAFAWQFKTEYSKYKNSRDRISRCRKALLEARDSKREILEADKYRSYLNEEFITIARDDLDAVAQCMNEMKQVLESAVTKTGEK
ncbi:hypothetical protein VCHA50O413_20350 [Vibrio chagasii]|nr:hypothetical protein VCHA34P114_140013 [Vibrio chagasii]CAH7003979.1 hypothetical protein VCHA50O405_10346 [Vibrio chagasii]CAH7009878.1 hypothetical protein VCHA50O387_140012 [Vibrio chagasii]CAH7092141.1 hypothetical protein VCHA50O402_20350 [Vibrio chagasii]CAH7143271.1 hypothetical protein VCHA50O413_20350 [Vibrio chagasii]